MFDLISLCLGNNLITVDISSTNRVIFWHFRFISGSTGLLVIWVSWHFQIRQLVESFCTVLYKQWHHFYCSHLFHDYYSTGSVGLLVSVFFPLFNLYNLAMYIWLKHCFYHITLSKKLFTVFLRKRADWYREWYKKRALS